MAKQVEEVSDEAFLRAWQTSQSRPEVVKRTGLPMYLVRYRALRLRQRGVNLKAMRPGRQPQPVDWDTLKKLAEKLA